jgi:hypothetical protein
MCASSPAAECSARAAGAANGRCPRARCLVDTDAQLALTDTVLPTAVRDRLTRLVLGL